MKRPSPLLVGGFIAILLSPLFAVAGPFQKTPAELDEKLKKTTERFLEFQKLADKRIPPQVLAKAKGIILLHKFKAGFGIGGEAGSGVALVRDANTGRWSPPAFVASAEGSWGLQLGAQESDIYLVLMNEEGLELLKDTSVNVGVDLQATADPSGVGGDLDTTTLKEPVLVYSNSEGLFAGAAFKGGGITSAKKNNAGYYGASMKEVLFEKKGTTTLAGRTLIAALRAFAGEKTERQINR